MDELKHRVKKELENISSKGITASNLDSTYKLVDIYKDILEIREKEEKDNYDRGRMRGDEYDRYSGRRDYYPIDERFERYMTRMREGMSDYDAGRSRYRDGSSNERMVEGIEMTMGAIVNFIESLMDIAETSQEKEIVRKYVDRIRKV